MGHRPQAGFNRYRSRIARDGAPVSLHYLDYYGNGIPQDIGGQRHGERGDASVLTIRGYRLDGNILRSDSDERSNRGEFHEPIHPGCRNRHRRCRTAPLLFLAAQYSLFSEDRPAPAGAVDTIDVQLSEMQLRRARPYGNCWLGCELWLQLGLHRFWERKLPRGRDDVGWPQVLELLVVNGLIDPGSDFGLHRQWLITRN
jgi:hypothetical protein